MWKDIAGHDRIKERLREYCTSGNVPHALLFSGAAGQGKTRVAAEFFKALNCSELTGEACGRCSSCLRAASGNHPDWVALNPEGRWIRVDYIREVIADIGLKPFEARWRCIVIEPAETLNTESANALLKTLEEPPDRTVIMLISHRPRLLLATLVSRCQSIRFAEAAGGDVQAGCGEGSSQGGEPCGAEDAAAIRQEVTGLLSGNDPALLARRYFEKEGWDLLPEVLMRVESVVRDILVLRNGSDRLVNEELRRVPLRHAGLEELDEILALVGGMRRGVAENINVRIAATELFVRLSQLGGR
jgi:DNA polymerase-3 subunit delta'